MSSHWLVNLARALGRVGQQLLVERVAVANRVSMFWSSFRPVAVYLAARSTLERLGLQPAHTWELDFAPSCDALLDAGLSRNEAVAAMAALRTGKGVRA